jgi:hypothetical protein
LLEYWTLPSKIRWLLQLLRFSWATRARISMWIETGAGRPIHRPRESHRAAFKMSRKVSLGLRDIPSENLFKVATFLSLI